MFLNVLENSHCNRGSRCAHAHMWDAHPFCWRKARAWEGQHGLAHSLLRLYMWTTGLDVSARTCRDMPHVLCRNTTRLVRSHWILAWILARGAPSSALPTILPRVNALKRAMVIVVFRFQGEAPANA